MENRVILYHKQGTSARTLFLRVNETVCLFDGLPTLSSVLEDAPTDKIAVHPAAILAETEQKLGLPPASIKIDSEDEFQASVDAPAGPINIILARFTATDPPREAVAPAGGTFIALTEARQLPATELVLLRLAYQAIMEG